jgi:uncharacterized coiled-coil protein SlyX
MTMDWGTTAQWGALVVAFIAFIRGEFRAQDKSYRADMEKVESRMGDCETKLARVSGELEHLPGKDLVHGLQLAMKEMQGQMDVIAERVKPIQAIASRMQEVLLENNHR